MPLIQTVPALILDVPKPALAGVLHMDPGWCPWKMLAMAGLKGLDLADVGLQMGLCPCPTASQVSSGSWAGLG